MTNELRQDVFYEEVIKNDYPNEMLDEFYNYWSEPNKKGKMRFELQKTWCTKRRLITWFNNQNKWYGKNNGQQGSPNLRESVNAEFNRRYNQKG